MIYPDHINHSEYLDTSLKTMPRDVSVDTGIMRSYDHWVSSVRVDCGRVTNRLVYDLTGLVAEAGELAKEEKSILRGDYDVSEDNPKGLDNAVLKEKILLECGDVLHYLSRTLEDIGSSLEEAASANVEKLTNRSIYGKGKRGMRS